MLTWAQPEGTRDPTTAPPPPPALPGSRQTSQGAAVPVLPGITVACSPGPHLSPRHSQDPYFTAESSSPLYGFMDTWGLIKFKVCSHNKEAHSAWLVQQAIPSSTNGCWELGEQSFKRAHTQSCGAQSWVQALLLTLHTLGTPLWLRCWGSAISETPPGPVCFAGPCRFGGAEKNLCFNGNYAFSTCCISCCYLILAFLKTEV